MSICRRRTSPVVQWLRAIPNIRQLCLVVALTFICSVYLAARTPMSKVYKTFHSQRQILDQARNLNDQRLRKAEDYFDGMKTGFTKPHANSLPDTPDNPILVVCIITANRLSFDSAKQGYLVQTAAIMDQLIKHDDYFRNSVFFVCNVDKQPDGHRDAVELQSHIHFVRKFGKNSFNRTFERFVEFKSRHHVLSRGKETEDYIFCLNASHSFGAPYVLMLEDDVMPYKNVFRVLNYTLTAHKFHSKQRDFSFLKLHYPERWLGFAFEMDRLIELFSLSIIGGAIIYSILVTCSKHNINNSVKTFYMVFGSLATMTCVSVIGRQYLMQIRRIHPQLFKFSPTAHCCTPAMMYNNEIVPSLVSYLMKHSTKNKDLAIYDFTEEAAIPGYMLEPNLFRHIGLYTSLGQGHKPPEEFLFNFE